MASKRHQRWKSCERKLRYESLEQAKAVARMMSRDHHTEMHVYQCQFCKQWHVGRMPIDYRRALERAGARIVK